MLIKDFNPRRGYLVFYTHYPSRKGRELEANPRGAGVCHWDSAGRQLRFEGPVTVSPAAESDAYFQRRPWLSQLNAWASDQSEPIADRAELLAQARERSANLGVPLDHELMPAAGSGALPRPDYWGGYRLWIGALEFWVHGGGRFHDRLRYQRDLASTADYPDGGPWSVVRLQP